MPIEDKPIMIVKEQHNHIGSDMVLLNNLTYKTTGIMNPISEIISAPTKELKIPKFLPEGELALCLGKVTKFAKEKKCTDPNSCDSCDKHQARGNNSLFPSLKFSVRFDQHILHHFCCWE